MYFTYCSRDPLQGGLLFLNVGMLSLMGTVWAPVRLSLSLKELMLQCAALKQHKWFFIHTCACTPSSFRAHRLKSSNSFVCIRALNTTQNPVSETLPDA